MRTLRFIVNGNVLTQDPSCDFSGMFPGATNRLEAAFTFSKEWQNCVKVVAFKSLLGKEYNPRIINDKETCEISPEALSLPAFKIQVLGKSRTTNLTTNELTIYQRGGTV